MPQLLGRYASALAVAMLFARGALCASNNVNVPGTADIWLAGQPNGTSINGGFGGTDVAPANSPVLSSTGLNLTAGNILTFTATGATDFGGCVSPGPDGGGACGNFTGAATLSLSSYRGPVNALVGVFLDNNAGGSVPPGIDFTPPSAQSQATIAPQLRQVFFIGDGLTGTGSGTVQQFVVPPGATRLFLASSDGPGASFNNAASFSVTVSDSPSSPGGPPASPAAQGVPAGSSLTLLLAGTLLIGVAGYLLNRRTAAS
jgi:hypothetical protein